MILFDTCVIFDVLDPSSPWHQWAKKELAKAVADGKAAVNTIIVAECIVQAEKPNAVVYELEKMGLNLLDLPIAASIVTSAAYKKYLKQRAILGQQGPKIPLPDFFIGGHAQAAKMELVTRDTARYKTYFPSVSLITAPKLF